MTQFTPTRKSELNLNDTKQGNAGTIAVAADGADGQKPSSMLMVKKSSGLPQTPMGKRLPTKSGATARARFRAGLPVTLKQLAVALDVGYGTALAWARTEGFPYLRPYIFPEDFKLWRQRRFGLLGQPKKQVNVPPVETVPSTHHRVYSSLSNARAKRLYEATH